MAATDFGALSTAQVRQWSAELWMAGRDNSFWFANGFIGGSDSDMNSVVQRVSKLSKTSRGLECVMQLVQDLQGDGTVNDNELENNEEAMTNDAIVIRIDMLRHGVRSRGEMSEQATVINFRSTAKEKLAFWLADKLDELMFLVASGRAFTLTVNGATRTNSQLPQLSFASDVAAASTNRIIYAGSATSEATLTSTDKMNWQVIVRTLAHAEVKRLRPIRGKGEGKYAMVMHTKQWLDLSLDPTYQTIVKSAGAQGDNKNILFRNATANVQGVVIYKHPKTFNTSGLTSGSKWGAASTVEGAQALLFGAQACGIALIGNVLSREQEKDYGNRPGIATGRIFGMLKPQFKSLYDSNTREDFGIVSVKTAMSA